MRPRLGVLIAATAVVLLSVGFPPADRLVGSSRLPDPQLAVTGLRYYESGGREWTRYLFSVENRAEYPDELFAPAPELPPCGLNTRAARTWVDFYDDKGRRLNGFCALENHDALGELWFALATEVAPPNSVYVELTDRASGNKLKSNLAPTTKGPCRP
jgi:hypothetical protein